MKLTDTYIHNWPLQRFSQEYGLASHITHVVLILYVSGGIYSLTSTPKDRFLRNFFMASLLTLSVFARINFIFHFWWLTWDMNPGFCTSNKPTQYILDHSQTDRWYILIEDHIHWFSLLFGYTKTFFFALWTYLYRVLLATWWQTKCHVCCIFFHFLPLLSRWWRDKCLCKFNVMMKIILQFKYTHFWGEKREWLQKNLLKFW